MENYNPEGVPLRDICFEYFAGGKVPNGVRRKDVSGLRDLLIKSGAIDGKGRIVSNNMADLSSDDFFVLKNHIDRFGLFLYGSAGPMYLNFPFGEPNKPEEYLNITRRI